MSTQNIIPLMLLFFAGCLLLFAACGDSDLETDDAMPPEFEMVLIPAGEFYHG